MKLACAMAACFAAAALEPDAIASPLIDLTGGADGAGGLQAGTVPGGASAAYFNPALLTHARAGLTVGVLVLSEQIGISLDGRPSTSYAVPGGVQNVTHADGTAVGQVPIPTNVLQNGRAAAPLQPAVAPHPRQGAGTGHATKAYETVGIAAKFFDERLTLGLYTLVPDGDYAELNAFYADEREQYFSNSLHPELYSDRLSGISLAFGAGYRFSDELSAGVGASLTLRAGVAAPTFVANAGQLQNILIDTNASVNMSLAPNAGVEYTPTPRLRVTGTAHAPEKVELNVDFTFLLPSGLQQGSSFTLIYDYMPWQFGAGLAYDAVKTDSDTVTLAATGVYGLWSGYRDRHGEAPLAAYGWYDTITPAAGLRYQHRAVGTYLDLQYRPSPVPLQTGRTNYVDNDRAGAGAGLDYAFEVARTPVRFGVQALAYWLLPRHQTKLTTPDSPDGHDHTPALVADELPDDGQVAGQPVAGSQGLQTNNPGFPGFGSSGVVFGGGVYVSVTP